MRKKQVGIFIATLLLFVGICAGSARADKSSAALEAPDQVRRGTEITIKVHVTHSANSFFHYTNWVSVKADGKEVRRWDYSMTHRPEAARFTKEIRLVIDGPTELEAQANCNLHGGQDPARKRINIAP